MKRPRTPIQVSYEVPEDFVALVETWRNDAISRILLSIWEGFDRLRARGFTIRGADANLERGITQQVCLEICVDQWAPYSLLHHPFEDETMKNSQGSPKAPDFAFLWRANPRAMFPVEAKQLETDGTISEYLKDLRANFLSCKYAPFSSQGAMVGYLRKGIPSRLFDNLSRLLRKELHPYGGCPLREHRFSSHARKVPEGMSYPPNFLCHHLVVLFTEATEL